jgi:hypothetical protein
MLKNLRDDERPGATGEKIPVGTDEEIRKRLLLFARKMFHSWGAMERATGIPHTTAVAWKKHGASLPGTESLIKLAGEGLSLDWLVTGRGQMQVRLGELRRGALLEDLRPSLQREAGVGDATGTQAFLRLVLRLRVDGLLERASAGLLPDFLHEVRLLDQLHRHAELVAWVATQLAEIEARVAVAKNGPPRNEFEVLRKRLHDYLPEDMRPGGALYAEFWEAVKKERQQFIEQVRLSMSTSAPAEPRKRATTSARAGDH